jgi:glycosyltransferase involved in cell wall biosynthesis
MAQISVAICTYNREKYLPQLFDSILLQNLPPQNFEILLIDNNSPGNTRELFEKFIETNPFIQGNYYLELNQGLSYARNRAIKEAKTPFITYLDDDAFIDSLYLTILLETFQKHPECGAIGGPILLHFEENKPRWENPYLNSLLGYFNKGNKIVYFDKKDYPRGSNMAFRMDTFERAGEFNVELGRIGKQLFGGEEKDIFNRMYKEKIPVIYNPKAIVFHCVPKARTTFEFIKKQALGTGISERLRSKKEGSLSYTKRLVMESIKWVASLLIWLGYSIVMKFPKGNMILFFRFWLTRGLIFKYKGQ